MRSRLGRRASARPLAGGGRRGTRLRATLALVAFLAGLVVIVALGAASDGHRSRPAAQPTPSLARQRQPAAQRPARAAAPPAAPARAPAALPRLTGMGGYDPEGDRRENDDLAHLATDGDPSTSWHTEHYRTFWKSGVGLLLDAGRPVRISLLVVTTDTPGYSARIEAGSDPRGSFSPVSDLRTVSISMSFDLRETTPLRYLLVWITALHAGDPRAGGVADVSEVRPAR